MATRAYLLPNDAELPVSQPCGVSEINNRPVLQFDGANNERCYWTITVPEGWKVSPQIGHAFIFYTMASASSGDVNVDVYVESVTPGDALNLHSADSFDAVNSVDGTTIPSSVGELDVIDVALSNHDSSVAGDLLRVWLERDATNDTAIGDMLVHAVEIQDSA